MAKTTKKATASVNGENVPVEEIHQLPVIKPLTPEEEATRKIQQYGEIFPAQSKAREWIIARKDENAVLSIDGVDDKEGYKKVLLAWQDLKNRRVAVEKIRKRLKEGILIEGRIIDGEAKELTALITENDGGEDSLKKMIDDTDNEKENIKQAAERASQEKLQGRVHDLLSIGMQFNGSYYAIGDTISVDVVTLKSMADDAYSRLKDAVATEFAKAEAEAKRLEDEKAEEFRKFKQQKADQEAKELELKQKEEALEKEKSSILKQRTDARVKQIEGMGMKFDYKSHAWSVQFGNLSEGITIPKTSLETESIDIWDDAVFAIAKRIEVLTQQQKEYEKALQDQKEMKDAKEKTRHDRRILVERDFKAVLEGPFYVRRFAYPEVEPITFLATHLDEEESDWKNTFEQIESYISHGISQENKVRVDKAIQAEQERQAALSDVERINEFSDKYLELMGSAPVEFANEQVRKGFAYVMQLFDAPNQALANLIEKYSA